MASLLPVATMLLAVLLSSEPLHLQSFAAVSPAFTLMVAYHWTIYRPDLLPPLALFMIGALQDLLAGGVPGVTPLLLLLCRAILLRRRHYFINRPFPFVWAGFALLIAAATPFLWALHSLFAAELLDFRSAIFGVALTVSAFPIASFLLGRSQRALMSAS